MDKFDPYPDDIMPKDDVKKFANWKNEEIIIYKYLELNDDKTFTVKQLFDNIKGEYPKIPSLDWVGIGLGVLSSFIKNIDFINFENLLKEIVAQGKIRAEESGEQVISIKKL